MELSSFLVTNFGRDMLRFECNYLEKGGVISPLNENFFQNGFAV